MTDIEPILKRLGLQQYLDDFVAEGFDTWASLLDIQESDLEHLNVKLGHRRKLQRAIAESRGWGSDKPLGSPSQDGSNLEVARPESVFSEAGSGRDGSVTTTVEQKRKYRRHPKPDDNAPEKPPSAYVLFSNRVREEVKSENLSFTEIARLVGERWQKLDPAQKDAFDSHASALKETYNAQLAEYKKTDAYKAYTQYLADFKAKHAATSEPKRPKLELKTSSSVSATSQGEASDAAISAPGHFGATSVSSSSAAPFISQSGAMPTAPPISTLTLSNVTPARFTSPSRPNPQERRILGHFSSQSSVSEESSSTRTDHGDSLSRAAMLSLTTPPAETPSPPITAGQITNRPEFSLGATYSPLTSRWPYYGHTPGPSGPPPGSTITSPLSTLGGGEHWRERSQEVTRPSYGPNTSTAVQSSGLLPISQLVADSRGPPSRVALPPPRQLAATANQPPFSPFGSFQQLPPPSPSSESMPLRHEYPRELPTRTESEGVDRSATSSERQGFTPQSRTERSRPGERE